MTNPGLVVENKIRALDEALAAVRREYLRAIEKFPPFNSGHEGYAVLLEEVEELFDEVKGNRPADARKEAIQVAAIAIRFVTDVRVPLP